MLQFVVLVRVCVMVCVHAVGEVVNCDVLIFLWLTRVIKSVDVDFLNMLNVSVLRKYVIVKSR
jgi:hypothetical protein